MSPHVVVAGIGNVFLGDDGFGVEVVRRLGAEGVPSGVKVSDVGIRTRHLAYDLLERPDLLVVVDATRRGEPPGTLYLIEPSLDAGQPNGASAQAAADPHGMNLGSVLAAVRQLGGEVPRVLLVGCEPAFLGEEMALSPAVAAAVPGAIEMVRDVLAREMTDVAAHAAEEAVR